MFERARNLLVSNSVGIRSILAMMRLIGMIECVMLNGCLGKLRQQKKTPQEKKIQSYVHDARNTYGQSDKGSRKRIGRRKSWVNQSMRTAVRRSLDVAKRDPTGLDSPRSDTTAIRRKDWEKWSDQPLVRVVGWRQKRRVDIGSNAEATEPTELQLEAQRRLRKSRPK